MSNSQQKELGDALWGIADKLRGAMNADDFRDYIFQTIMKLRQIRSLVKIIQIVRKKLKT